MLHDISQPSRISARRIVTVFGRFQRSSPAAPAADRTVQPSTANLNTQAPVDRIRVLTQMNCIFKFAFPARPRCDGGVPPSRLASSSAGGCGEEGSCCCFYHPPSGGGLDGRTAAAAGSGWTCWLSQELSSPSPSRVLFCRLCLTSQEREKIRLGKKWPYSLRFPQGLPTRRKRTRREWHRRSIYCCCGSPPCWTYIIHSSSFGLYVYTFGLRMCADSTTPSYLRVAISGGPAGGAQGKRDLGGCFYHLLGWRPGWKDCCCGWLLLDQWTCWLSQERSASSPSRVLCYRLRLTSQEKKNQAWKEVALHPPLSAGPAGSWPYGSGTGGAPAAMPFAANALYASRRQLRARPRGGGGGALSWTGSLLSTPPAADFGPGPEGRRRGVQLDRELLPMPLADNFGPCPTEGGAAGLRIGFARL